jgi:hypothetical protein
MARAQQLDESFGNPLTDEERKQEAESYPKFQFGSGSVDAKQSIFGAFELLPVFYPVHYEG